MKLHIRNMVCDRCIQAVKSTLLDLGFHPTSVVLGEVELVEESLSPQQLAAIDQALNAVGFERIDDRRGRIIEKIKTFVIRQIREAEGEQRTNWSDLIADELHYEYSYLSALFSSVEGITLEQYIIRQKIERVKELLVYDELSLGEIAWKLGYSSTAHLSSQFKKVTGLPPSHFKAMGGSRRKPLDKI